MQEAGQVHQPDARRAREGLEDAHVYAAQFAALQGQGRYSTYVYSDEFRGFVSNELPSFWSTKASKSFALFKSPAGGAQG
jgi:hypothetical protein